MPAAAAGPPAVLLPALRWAEETLRRGRIDEPRLNAELLLCHVLRCERIRLYAEFERNLAREEIAEFGSLLRRRLDHEPLQYITGSAGFMGLTFSVDRRVLIPRPETETLVETVLDALRTGDRAGAAVLDAGTGSGNIAVSIAHFLAGARVVGIDVSREALRVARGNVRRHGVEERVALVRADLSGDRLPFPPAVFDVLVSNPPYVSAAEAGTLAPEIRLHEPSLATTAGGDGLLFYRRLARIGRTHVRPGGLLAVECGYNQARQVEEILAAEGYAEVRPRTDLSGVERVITGRR